MRNSRISVTVGILAVSVGCSSTNSGTGLNAGKASPGGGADAGGSSGGQATGNAGGSSGSQASGDASPANGDASASGAGGDGGSACVLPSCLKNLAPSCVGTGTCATMTNLDTDNYNTCFPNGVIESAVIDQTSGNTTLTIKQNTTTCFSTTFNYVKAWSGTGSIAVVDASGNAVASVRMDANDNLRNLVTCAGGQEIPLDLSCQNVWPISALTGSKCNEGGCTPK